MISDVPPASSVLATPFCAPSSIPSFVSASKESSCSESGESSESGVDCREVSSSALSSTRGLVGLGEADSGGGVNDELLLPGVSARGDGGADE